MCRFYCDKTVPDGVVATLRKNGAEVVFIENIKGGIAGMFWRFLVADDPTVDRWIVRDSDSRLNPRERFAVEEWIQSGKVMHTIRDHPNHERPMNGGLIGGTKHAIPVRRMIISINFFLILLILSCRANLILLEYPQNDRSFSE